MLVGCRYRLCPTNGQAEMMRRFCGARRFVYNLALEQRKLAFELTGTSPGYSQQTAQLKELRDDPELTWLKEIPAQVLQQAVKDLDVAYQRFFRRLGSYPRFKRKWVRESFRVPQHVDVRKLSSKWGEVKLQGLGWVRYRRSRSLGGSIKNATVRYEGGCWFVSLQLSIPDLKAVPNGGSAIGVDRGVTHALAVSDERFFDAPQRSVKEDERLLRLERKRSRQKKGSKNRAKTNIQIAKIHATRKRRRLDFCHKTTTLLAKQHELIALEALNTKNMTATAKGTLENPGTNVKQKAGLNRAILQSGWGIIEKQLEYKTGWYGSQLVKVPAAYTSLQCARCGHTHKENRKNQAVFQCARCDHKTNADTNAAKIILKRANTNKTLSLAAGPVVTACGDPETSESIKQEPLKATA